MTHMTTRRTLIAATLLAAGAFGSGIAHAQPEFEQELLAQRNTGIYAISA